MPIAARISWVTTEKIAAIIDRQKVLAADALEEYMVYVFDKLGGRLRQRIMKGDGECHGSATRLMSSRGNTRLT